MFPPRKYISINKMKNFANNAYMASQLDSLDELFVNAQKKDYINSKLRKWSTVDSPKKIRKCLASTTENTREIVEWCKITKRK